MNIQSLKLLPTSPGLRSQCLAGILALCLGAALPAWGQGRGGFGGAGGAGGAGSRGGTGSSTTTRTYPNNSTIGDAYFTIDPESHQVLTIADEDTSKYLSMVLSNLDRPKPQVLIKAVFLEVTHVNNSDIGVEGGWGKQIGSGTSANGANVFGLGGLTTTNSPLNVLGQPTTTFNPANNISSSGAGFYQIMGQDYQATLRAIAAAGKTKVLSKPSILARNNQPATIFVGMLVQLVNSVRYDNFGNAIYSPTPYNIGVTLTVTPFINSKDLVEMIVNAQISQLDPTVSEPISSTVSIPAIDERSAQTVVVTPDKHTVVIGGLMQKSKMTEETKIPFLGDIPLLGNLFKRQQKTDAQDELFVFLTPEIVPAPPDLTALTKLETDKSNIQKNFSEKEINQFLENLPSGNDAPPPHADVRHGEAVHIEVPSVTITPLPAGQAPPPAKDLPPRNSRRQRNRGGVRPIQTPPPSAITAPATDAAPAAQTPAGTTETPTPAPEKSDAAPAASPKGTP